MSEAQLHEEVVRIEGEIEELAERLERCRKLTLLAKLAIAAGAILLLATVLGLISFEPLLVMFAIAATLGGTVVFGSNTTTRRQLEAALHTAEATLNQLIDKIDPRPVNGNGS